MPFPKNNKNLRRWGLLFFKGQYIIKDDFKGSKAAKEANIKNVITQSTYNSQNIPAKPDRIIESKTMGLEGAARLIPVKNRLRK